MIPKNLDQDITENDLQILKENSILEGKTIEYKQSLPGNSDSERKEFLADVSSFANASGGDLIYGIVEDKETGIPQDIIGIDIENVDEEKRRLESMIQDGIEPRIMGIMIRFIPLSNSKKALIIRIPKSWISPHRVSFKGHNKFYSRNNSGKYELDVSELRIAFNLSETMIDRIRRFREERISKIYANETPVLFYDATKIVLHLIPIISFLPAKHYDINRIASRPEKIKPIFYDWNYYRYNLDGFLTCYKDEGGKSDSYVQVFKNGIIESVIGLPKEISEKLLIPIDFLEKELIKSLQSYLQIFKILDIEPPILTFLTLVGVKGYSMARRPFGSLRESIHTIDRDILLLPETLLEIYDIKAEHVLKPCFDAIWNACGYPRSLNYDEAGNWIGE